MINSTRRIDINNLDYLFHESWIVCLNFIFLASVTLYYKEKNYKRIECPGLRAKNFNVEETHKE